MIIKNGSVFTSDGFEKKDIAFDTSHRIMAALPSADPDVFDAEGCYVVPGFIDIHTHGAVGADFCDADLSGLKRMAAYLKSCGITTFCPTSMTFLRPPRILWTHRIPPFPALPASIWKVLLSLPKREAPRRSTI